MDEQLIDTWNIHNRILLYLLDAINPDGIQGAPTGMKGRSVGSLFAHVHNARLMWLEVSSPRLMEGLAKIPTRSKADKEALTKDLLCQSLEASGRTMATLLEEGVRAGKIKNARPHLTGFFGYLIAHEWYHLGEICMTLTEAGHRLDDQVLYAIWEWQKFTP